MKYKNNLKETRELNKLTQEELAKKINLKLSTYQKIENGTNQTNYNNLKMLSKQLNTSVDYLINNEINNLDLSPIERELIINFRKLSTEKQKALLTTSTIN